uniref:ATP-binding protein n=1 Tax=Aquiflexum sp. TaxID=1872584 RepID=UPI0035947872
GIIKGPDYVYELANPLYLELIGVKDVIGKTVKEVLPELEAQGIFQFLDTVYETGETFSANEMLVKFDHHGNGELVDRYLNFIYQANRNNEGIIDGILFFASDVTELVLARKKAEESENRYKELIQNLPIATYSCDTEGNILLYNKAAAALWGREPEIGIDKWCGSWKVYNENGKPLPLDLCPMAIALKEGRKITDQEIIVERPNGDMINVLPYPVPFMDSTGRVTGAVNVLIDITERKKANEKLKKQNQELDFQFKEKEYRTAELSLSNKELVKTNMELDRFVYSVSHDLRSPLTSILGLIAIIEEESREPDTLEQVKMIRTSINRLDGFIRNILSYSQNNRTGLENQKIPIKKTINEIVDSVRHMKGARGISFQIDIDEQEPFYSDLQRFNTILENLISNAIKYHTEEVSGRYLKLTGTTDNKELKLSISDNGIGIDPKFHDKLFDMFYRLPGNTEGTGLGLYIVKDTLEKMQGTIEIQSEKGEGTTFNIKLKNLIP